MCYFLPMSTSGLRDLRQRASELVRAAEGGEIIDVTVSGRVVAQLGPVQRDHWRRWAEVIDVWAGPPDADWQTDRDLVDQRARDPFDA